MKATKKQIRKFLNESRGRVEAEAALLTELREKLNELIFIQEEILRIPRLPTDVIIQMEELDAVIAEIGEYGKKLEDHFDSAGIAGALPTPGTV